MTIFDLSADVIAVDTSGGRHRLTVKVPETSPIGGTELRVVTAAGVLASAPGGVLPFEVITGIRINDVRPGKITLNPAGQVVVKVLGAGFVVDPANIGKVEVEVDGEELQSVVAAADGRSIDATVTGAVAATLSAKPQANLIVKNDLGYRSEPFVVELR